MTQLRYGMGKYLGNRGVLPRAGASDGQAGKFQTVFKPCDRPCIADWKTVQEPVDDASVIARAFTVPVFAGDRQKLAAGCFRIRTVSQFSVGNRFPAGHTETHSTIRNYYEFRFSAKHTTRNTRTRSHKRDSV